MSLAKDLEARGMIKQVTDPTLFDLMSHDKLTVYAGFDPTSDSLHIGSLLPLLALKRFQLAGHKPIAVVGGATGMIGDPSGKSDERSLLTAEKLEHNVAGILKVIDRFLDFDGKQPAQLVNNADWFKGFGYLDFLRDVGKHFTVNHMIAKESVKARLEDREHGISYTEFSYMLLQAYDFYILNERHHCTVQIGGSDQWGNITAGCELIRRMRYLEGKPPPQVFGMTFPLVMKSDGGKFGKTESGTIWLDANKTSPYHFYQFLLQSADADVITYLNYFSFLSVEKIAELKASIETAPEKREAQNALADELTTLVHGKEELEKAKKASKALFGTEIKELDAKTLLEVFSETPSTKKEKGTVSDLELLDLLVESGLCKSKGQARKDVQSGGVYINNERENDPTRKLSDKDLMADSFVLIRKGKKNYHIVSFE